MLTGCGVLQVDIAVLPDNHAEGFLQHLESCLKVLTPLQLARAFVACAPWTPDVVHIMSCMG